MKQLATFISKYFGIIVIIFTLLGFFLPGGFAWVTSKVYGQSVINLLLGVVMFGMGMTLRLSDFKLVLQRPLDVFKGTAAQFIVMPLLAILLANLFGLPEELLIGVVLVGTCPGGTASNVITYMAGGDVALSVTMTSVSTLLAPILTPALTYLLIHETVDFNPVAMFMSILQVIILPITLGIIANYALKEKAKKIAAYTPAFSALAIACIVAGVIGANGEKILSSFGLILLVVMLHNLLGYALGFGIARLTGMSRKSSITLAIEVGMQNSGLAASLAATQFASMPLAAVPAAIFSTWHNISGSLLAWVLNYFRLNTSGHSGKNRVK